MKILILLFILLSNNLFALEKDSESKQSSSPLIHIPASVENGRVALEITPKKDAITLVMSDIHIDPSKFLLDESHPSQVAFDGWMDNLPKTIAKQQAHELDIILNGDVFDRKGWESLNWEQKEQAIKKFSKRIHTLQKKMPSIKINYIATLGDHDIEKVEGKWTNKLIMEALENNKKYPIKQITLPSEVTIQGKKLNLNKPSDIKILDQLKDQAVDKSAFTKSIIVNAQISPSQGQQMRAVRIKPIGIKTMHGDDLLKSKKMSPTLKKLWQQQGFQVASTDPYTPGVVTRSDGAKAMVGHVAYGNIEKFDLSDVQDKITIWNKLHPDDLIDISNAPKTISSDSSLAKQIIHKLKIALPSRTDAFETRGQMDIVMKIKDGKVVQNFSTTTAESMPYKAKKVVNKFSINTPLITSDTHNPSTNLAAKGSADLLDSLNDAVPGSFSTRRVVNTGTMAAEAKSPLRPLSILMIKKDGKLQHLALETKGNLHLTKSLDNVTESFYNSGTFSADNQKNLIIIEYDPTTKAQKEFLQKLENARKRGDDAFVKYLQEAKDPRTGATLMSSDPIEAIRNILPCY